MATTMFPSSDSEAAAVRAERLFFAGVGDMEGGDGSRAEQCFREALQLLPGLAEAAVNLAFLLEGRGAFEEAEACYRRAVAAQPELLQGWLNLGALLLARERPEEALPVCRQAVTLAPRFAQAWSNLGAAHSCGGDGAEAERCYRTALALNPGYPTARFNLSYVLLRQGRYDEGWACFEARPWVRDLAARFSCPRWQGQDLAGRRLLLVGEAGHGDMIQFCRYIPKLQARGARITLLCHPGLARLLGDLAGVAEVLPLGPAPVGEWDFWVPQMSLPHLFSTTRETIPAALPYLRPRAELTARWAGRLPAGGLRVGLAWRGNPQFENDRQRSLPGLETLAPLGRVAGIALVSLQKGAGEAEAARPPAGLALTDLGSQVQDFADTAALIAGLDLVIAVDTAVAHLAGALGKPCWLLLPHYKPDWRWLEGGDHSPWYPGVLRLFRQSARGDWPGVVAEVVLALEAWAGQGAGAAQVAAAVA